MKATIEKERNKNTFKPFKLIISIETEEEAQELFHRFNFAIKYDVKMYDRGNYKWDNEQPGNTIWEDIKKELEAQGFSIYE
jgi:hypothetical protein